MVVADVSKKSVAELISLRGRVAVVTGGAVGIGLSIARRFAEAGTAIAIGDLDKAGAEAAAEAIHKEFGGRAIGVWLDVVDEMSVRELADRAVAELGGLDIWVNNAGIYPSVPFLEMTALDWNKVLDVNLQGSFFGAQEAAKRMVAAATPPA